MNWNWQAFGSLSFLDATALLYRVMMFLLWCGLMVYVVVEGLRERR